VFHQLSTRFPHSRFATLVRGLGVAVVAACLVTPAGLRAEAKAVRAELAMRDTTIAFD